MLWCSSGLLVDEPEPGGFCADPLERLSARFLRHPVARQGSATPAAAQELACRVRPIFRRERSAG